ncbi:MAG: hypothetical protein OXC64_06700 [Flavobacteriaceae bacterium]|nr:hypothetical protein [Flavobacteriaceae bacterium]
MWDELGHTILGLSHLYQCEHITKMIVRYLTEDADRHKQHPRDDDVEPWPDRITDMFIGKHHIKYSCRNRKGRDVVHFDLAEVIAKHNH